MSSAPTAGRIGVIAGAGELPVIQAQGVLSSGHTLVGLGLGGHDPQLKAMCQHFATASPLRPGSWVKKLQRWQCHQAILVGRVPKEMMYSPWQVIRHLPDTLSLRLWCGTLKGDRRSQRLLRVLADALQTRGLTLLDTTQYIPDHLALAGVMTRCRPNAQQQADIALALPILRDLNLHDVGQGLCVGRGEVIALEGIEGTDRMLVRAGELTGKGGRGWVLVKGAPASKDPRFDVPTVGVATIENLAKQGAGCLAVIAERTILINKPEVLAAADKAGIAVVGIPAGEV